MDFQKVKKVQKFSDGLVAYFYIKGCFSFIQNQQLVYKNIIYKRVVIQVRQYIEIHSLDQKIEEKIGIDNEVGIECSIGKKE